MRPSLLRRLFHFSGVIIPITYLSLGKSSALLVTTIILVLLAIAEFVRLGLSLDVPFLRRHLKEEEIKNPTGSLFYMVSCLLVILLFGRSIAVASILVLVVSDPLASTVGSRWGRHRFSGKSAEGTIAFFLSSVIVLKFFSFGSAPLLAAAAAATATEFFSSRFINDNFSIPLATALMLSCFR
jgi:dolichol kinase